MVFYADDDADDQEFFSDIIREMGRTPVLFSHGDSLMHRMHNPPPAAGIVFLDINMPKRSGIEILREIRSNKEWDHVPVIMLSTSSEADFVESSFAEGANFYISKATSIQGLRKALQHTLSIDWKTFRPSAGNFVYAA